MLRVILVLFLFGALIGNGFNSLHAYMGTIPITPIHISPLLDWTSYLLFGFSGVSIGMLTLLFDGLRKSKSVVSLVSAVWALALLGIFYFCSACMFLSNTAILVILIAGFVLSLLLYDRSIFAVLAALLVAIAGTGAEIFFVHSGMYYYARPQVMGVTYWLPFLYAIASVTTGQLARALAQKDLSQCIDL